MTWKTRRAEASRRIARLLEDVERDRDRLAANSLTLRFVWHQTEHPHPGKLWETGYLGDEWCVAGRFVARMALQTNLEPTPYDCRVYLVRGDDRTCEVFTDHYREAEAIWGRLAGDGTRFHWAKELFETFHDAVDHDGRDAVEWRENEEPDSLETWSYVAELRDIFEWTRILLKAFRDGAESRQQSLSNTPIKTQSKPDGPFGTNSFRFGSNEKTGLTPTPYKLLRHLWSVGDRTATFAELAEAVWDDKTRDGYSLRNDGRLSSARRVVNNFMESGEFPFRVRTSAKNEVAELVEAIQRSIIPVKRSSNKKARKSSRTARQ